MKRIIPEQISPDGVAKEFNVSRESLEKLKIYAQLLGKWQKRINLVGPRETNRIWSRHICDALQLAQYIGPEIKIAADLGSGAGIPGAILAMAKPGFVVHLIESNGKKAAFLREVIRETGISAQLHCARIENLYQHEWVENVQVVVARALAPLPLLVDLAAPFVKNDGKMLFLKGLDVDSELTETTKYWNMVYKLYPSRTDAGGCILNIKEFHRVPGSTPNDGRY